MQDGSDSISPRGNPGQPLLRRRLLRLGAVVFAASTASFMINWSTLWNQSRRKWLQSESRPNEADYLRFLATLQLKHITAEEIIRCHHRVRDGVSNTLPPHFLWQNIVPTLKIIDSLRERIEEPVTLLSAYRTPAYNARCPGAARNSQHKFNRALDVKFANCSSRKAFRLANQMREQNQFRGGLGLYSSFIHVDTRGKNATWGN